MIKVTEARGRSDRGENDTVRPQKEGPPKSLDFASSSRNSKEPTSWYSSRCSARDRSCAMRAAGSGQTQRTRANPEASEAAATSRQIAIFAA